MNEIKNVCVYCASSTQVAPVYFDAASRLGEILASQGINLINGAGCQGLMRSVSDAVLAGGNRDGSYSPVHGRTRMAPQRAYPACTDRNHARAQAADD